MPGHVKSDSKKHQIARKCHDQLMEKAVITYKNELAKPSGAPWKGARKICKDFEALYQRETGKEISLSYSTLICLADSGKTKAQSNMMKSHLFPDEAGKIIDYILAVASEGFSFSHRCLKEHINEVLQA
ncbi:hypothetical protein EV421DRAFT_1721678 [Armillaria borealis]|uniref:Uncharacterized protein n=1 Tax=Armillaria borealis TaxID=47425 RepID=A0AA39IUV0_9AGAR|nr:hypothetical protein EV421DRAFT_1721678 [Armillaria borealis]